MVLAFISPGGLSMAHFRIMGSFSLYASERPGKADEIAQKKEIKPTNNPKPNLFIICTSYFF
jgi:hypothetical protein